jgi:hypothetical protein
MDRSAGTDAAFAPDFFIVGAPKCATSSLHVFLARRPDVFMCTPKEPHFFCRDLPGLAEVDDDAAYRALFAAAPPGALLGEASAFYLASEAAPRAIHARNPRARIILSIREPAAACVSWHQQLRNGLREDQADFATSWMLQDARARGERLPAYRPEPKQLQYRWLYSYHDQIARYLDLFGPEQVLVLRFEDVRSDPVGVARRLLAHLGLPPGDAPPPIPEKNVRRAPRYPALQQFVAAPPAVLRPLMVPVKRALNAIGVTPSKVMMRHLSSPAVAAPQVAPDVMAEVRAAFAEDVARLERLLGIDLAPWRAAAPNADQAIAAP